MMLNSSVCGALCAALALLVQSAAAQDAAAPLVASAAGGPSAAPIAPTVATTAAMVELAQRDPGALVELGRQRYQLTVQSYRCTFVKQERIKDKLLPEQEIEVRYREQPHAIYMVWRRNADKVRRALYMDAPEFRDKHGAKLARVEPHGAIARLFVSDLFYPVDSDEGRETSRRPMTDFGFRVLFDVFANLNNEAQKRGVLKLKYVGEGTIDNRKTFIIERYLPYTGDKGPYPDAKMIMHLDQEWLLPTAIFTYADNAQKKLIASYVYKNVELNPVFTDATFKF